MGTRIVWSQDLASKIRQKAADDDGEGGYGLTVGELEELGMASAIVTETSGQFSRLDPGYELRRILRPVVNGSESDPDFRGMQQGVVVTREERGEWDEFVRRYNRNPLVLPENRIPETFLTMVAGADGMDVRAKRIEFLGRAIPDTDYDDEVRKGWLWELRRMDISDAEAAPAMSGVLAALEGEFRMFHRPDPSIMSIAAANLGARHALPDRAPKAIYDMLDKFRCDRVIIDEDSELSRCEEFQEVLFAGVYALGQYGEKALQYSDVVLYWGAHRFSGQITTDYPDRTRTRSIGGEAHEAAVKIGPKIVWKMLRTKCLDGIDFNDPMSEYKFPLWAIKEMGEPAKVILIEALRDEDDDVKKWARAVLEFFKWGPVVLW